MNAQAPRIPEVGEVVAGKYRLMAVLGRGGMGVVFDGHHELLDRRVAIKVLAPEILHSKEAVTRFLNEARAAARITSDRVVHVLDVGLLDGGLPFMVMERLEGVDLAQLGEQQGRMDVPDVVDLLMEGIEGVAHAHLEGVIHRDLKPSNLFLARRPDKTSVVKILDFGISKITASGGASGSGNVTSTHAVLGSPLYMSPEQLRSAKTIDVRADIWSLGVIAYELLTGTLPFDGENIVEIFAAIQERDVRPVHELRPDVPLLLDDAIRRCLRRAKEDRFPNVFALAQALMPFGSRRAQTAMARLEAHVSSKGLAFEDLSSTLPQIAIRDTAPPAPERASRPVGAVTPPTMQSQTPAPEPPQGRPSGGELPVKPAVATSAPWSSTRSGSTRPRSPTKVAAIVGAAVFTTALFVSAVVVVRAKLGPSHEDTPVQAAGLVFPAPSAPSPQSPPSTAQPAPPATGIAPDAAALIPSSDDKPKPNGGKPHPPPSTHPQSPIAPPAPAQPLAPAPKPANPLTMKPI